MRKFIWSSEGFCEHEAKHRKKENKKRKPHNRIHVRCKGKMVTAQEKASCMAVLCVKDFIDEHKHPLVTKDLDSLLCSHKRSIYEEKAYIIEMEFLGFEAP